MAEIVSVRSWALGLYKSANTNTSSPKELFVVKPLADLPYVQLSRSQRRLAMKDAQNLIQKKYHSGAPFFARATMEDVVKQLDEAISRGLEKKKKKLVRITGLDERVVEFELKCGRTYPWEYDDEESICVMTKPCLQYTTAADLLTAASSTDMFHPTRVYLPIELAHWTETRNRLTGASIPLVPTLSYPATLAKISRFRTSFQAGTYYHHLMLALSSVPLPWAISNIVAFGCGSLSWDTGKEEDASSVAQHILLCILRDVLSTQAGYGHVRCVAQDPVYTEVDKKVLGEKRVHVLDDPRAFLEVTGESVVVAVCPDIPVREIVCDLARPAVLLWSVVEEREGEDEKYSDPASSRVRRMIRDEYTHVPIAEENDCFYNMALYVRNEK